MVYSRPPWRRRRRGTAESPAPRPLGCLWPIFWLILIIVLLGLLFGGYRKGTRVGAPQGHDTFNARTYDYSSPLAPREAA